MLPRVNNQPVDLLYAEHLVEHFGAAVPLLLHAENGSDTSDSDRVIGARRTRMNLITSKVAGSGAAAGVVLAECAQDSGG